MGIKHLSQAHPDANFIGKALIAFIVLSFINLSINSSSDQENYYFVYQGKEYSVVVEKGEDPIAKAQVLVTAFEVGNGIFPPNEMQVSESDLTKRKKSDQFWRFEGALVMLGVLWIIARYTNRLFLGENHHTKDDW